MKIKLKPDEVIHLLNIYRTQYDQIEIKLRDEIAALKRKVLAQEIIINMQTDKKSLVPGIIVKMDEKKGV